MPEFVLDHGSRDTANRFAQLDSFTQGYIEALFFTDTGTGDDGELEHATVDDLAPSAWEKIIADCKRFQELNRADLDEACDFDGYDEQCCGNDFWYTRNGHGVGYWCRDEIGDMGDRLTYAAKRFGEVDFYRGDDGLLYLS